jgi:hypothetical protein
MQTITQATEHARRSSEHEGRTTKAIENVTSKLPSGTWLLLAGGSILGSLALKLLGKDSSANFVGQWAPTLLLIGLYNKLVKVVGSERGELKIQ